MTIMTVMVARARPGRARALLAVIMDAWAAGRLAGVAGRRGDREAGAAAGACRQPGGDRRPGDPRLPAAWHRDRAHRVGRGRGVAARAARRPGDPHRARPGDGELPGRG